MTSPPTGPLRAHAIRGVLQVGVASVLIRSGGLLSQLVAGRILVPEEFGLFAAALGVSTFSIAAAASVRPLLIERLVAGDEQTDALWRVCFWTVTSLSLLLMLAADSVSVLMDEPKAATVIRVTLAVAPLQFLAVFGMAKVGAALQFSQTSRILTSSAFLRYAAVIGLALAGFGAYALVVPLFVEAVAQIVFTSRLKGRPPSIFGPMGDAFRTHRRTLLWIAVSSAALAISMTGDYALLSILETTANVGIYFFAFQLTAAITQPFTMASSSVLVPSFANASTPDAAGRSFFSAVRLQLAVTGIAFGGLALIGGAAVDLIWSGRWNAGTGVLVAIAIGTPMRMMNPLANALLQARGDFRRPALLLTFNAASLVVGVLVGSVIGGITATAAAVSVSFFVLGAVVVIVAAREAGRTAGEALSALTVGVAAPAAGLAAAFALFPGTLVSVAESFARAVVFVAVAGPTAVWMLRRELADTVAAVRPKVRS